MQFYMVMDVRRIDADVWVCGAKCLRKTNELNKNMIKKDALKEFEFSTNTFRILNITTCWMFGLVFVTVSRVYHDDDDDIWWSLSIKKPNHPSYFQNGTFNLSHIHNSTMISMSTQFLHSNVLSVGPLTKLSTSLVFHLHRTLSAFLIFSLSHSHSLGTGVFIISFGNRVTRCNIEIKKTKRKKENAIEIFSHHLYPLCTWEDGNDVCERDRQI